MFKTLNQKEMINVNGGFKYIPVYEVKKYYKNGIFLGQDKEKFKRLEQVASSDSRNKIVYYTRVDV